MRIIVPYEDASNLLFEVARKATLKIWHDNPAEYFEEAEEWQD